MKLLTDQEVIERFRERFGEFPSLKFMQEGNTVKTVEIAQWKEVEQFILQTLHQHQEALLEIIESMRKERGPGKSHQNSARKIKAYNRALDDPKARITGDK